MRLALGIAIAGALVTLVCVEAALGCGATQTYGRSVFRCRFHGLPIL
jgi:hypothetical protein